MGCGVKLLSDYLVRPGCCRGAVPDGAVRLIGQCLGEGSVRASKLVGRHRLLDRGDDQRVSESKYSRVERPEGGGDSRRQVGGVHRLSRRPAQLGQVDFVERRQEKQSLHVCAERRESRRERLLESSGQRQRSGLRRVRAKLGRGCRELDQGEWIAGRFLEDPAPEIDRQGRRAKVEEGVRSIQVQAGEGEFGQIGVVE